MLSTTELLSEHDQTLRQERLLEPGRFVAASPQRSSQRVAPRPMQAEVPTGQIEFKEVQVRSLDKQNITQLRASRGLGGNASSSMAEGGVESSFADHHHPGEISVRSVKTVTAILNPCVDATLLDKLYTFVNPDDITDPIIATVDALVSKKFDDEEGKMVLLEVSQV